MPNVLEQVEESIRARKLFARGERILVAVSGGLDSVVLLDLLQTLAEKHDWKLTVAHFNHCLRGRASDGDERFVCGLATRLKLPCVTERADVKAKADQLGISIEMAARKLRHGFLARTAQTHGIRSIAIAHHGGDQVELFFLRLLRGTGTEGLAGMKWRSPSPANCEVEVVRPLLNFSRAELERFARAKKLRFRKDSSNASHDIPRNQIRHVLLPLLRRRFQPAVDRSVLRLMEIAGAESDALHEFARSYLKGEMRKPFASLPIALQRRVLRLQLLEQNVLPEFDSIEKLRALPGKPLDIEPLISVSRDITGRVHLHSRERFEFNPDESTVTLERRGGKGLFGDVRFRWRFASNNRSVQRKGGEGLECFDADLVGETIVLRHWRPADRYQPIGLGFSVKLQDWFTNQKIPAARRRRLVLATTADGRIFWIEGMRISEKFKLSSGTRRTLVWRWRYG